jgi:hypothetical protein
MGRGFLMGKAEQARQREQGQHRAKRGKDEKAAHQAPPPGLRSRKRQRGARGVIRKGAGTVPALTSRQKVLTPWRRYAAASAAVSNVSSRR